MSDFMSTCCCSYWLLWDLAAMRTWKGTTTKLTRPVDKPCNKHFQTTGGNNTQPMRYNMFFFWLTSGCYVIVGNKRGIGARENNLSATFLSIGDNENAERHCNAAVTNTTGTLQTIEQAGDGGGGGGSAARYLRRAKETLSDRKGKLVVIYLQQNRFVEAFRVLEEVLVQDRSNMYFRGLVMKHGTLGHYYLKQGELACVLTNPRLHSQSRRARGRRMEQWSITIHYSISSYYLQQLSYVYTYNVIAGTGFVRANSALQHSHSGSGESIDDFHRTFSGRIM